jgi:uncharacterized protein YjbI with pentapeptide repeats
MNIILIFVNLFLFVIIIYEKNAFIILVYFFLQIVMQRCDDPLTDGVDYSNCRFSDAQDLQGSYLPNSNLSFASFIQVNFDKSIMMNSNLSFGTFPESTFVRANLYETVSIGANFEKTNFSWFKFNKS